jgi:hypothetical protein
MITIQAIDSEGVVIREFTTNNPDKADAFRYGLEARSDVVEVRRKGSPR